MAAGAPPWDPEVLARIGALHLRARQASLGLQHGAHRSNRVASNVEFADYKEYAAGDPLKDLDWRVAARSDHGSSIPRPASAAPNGSRSRCSSANCDSRGTVVRSTG